VSVFALEENCILVKDVAKYHCWFAQSCAGFASDSHFAVVCGRDFAKNDVSEQDVETCSKESGNPSTERLANDGNLVVNDYEDLKSTGYLEVVTLIAFDVNIVVS
jgi:hypothetical protein